MNPFERHGIKHLSPSACNQFIGAPGLFILERLMKKRFSVGPAAHRGTAVEDGIVHGLMTGASLKECQDVAREKFEKLVSLTTDPRVDKERAGLAGMVEQGLKELLPYGKPSATQGKIEYQFEGLEVPFIGYFDLEWEDHGVLTDIKTTHALPSKISINHARQVALYRAARGNADPRVTYVTPKKVATYRLENADQHVEALGKIGMTIQRFLARSDDPMELASLMVPDFDSFYWSDPAARAEAYKIWGI